MKAILIKHLRTIVWIFGWIFRWIFGILVIVICISWLTETKAGHITLGIIVVSIIYYMAYRAVND